MGTEYLWGTCHPARELATYIKLTVDRDAPLPGKDGEPGTWAGVSGGPVLVKDGRYRGYLYGIVRASPRRFGDSLYAVGTPALLHDAELCNLLGIKGPAPPHASLVERLRDLIAQDGDLAEKLASLDPVWKSRWDDEDADGLVDELCTRGSLKEALERLRGLCQRLESTTRVVEDLAVTLVSILASRDLPGGRDLTADSVRRIQLGTASPNFAEALLAAAYGAPCRYEKVDGPKPDLPRAYLRVPAPTLEGGLLPDSQTEEQLKEILWKFLKNDLASSKWVLDGEKAIFDHLPPGRQKKMLEQLVEQKLGRMKENHGRPAYLVVVGKMQESAGIGPFLDQLKEVLPSLDLVVLESDFERVSDALRQEDELWPLWEILNLVPEEFRP